MPFFHCLTLCIFFNTFTTRFFNQECCSRFRTDGLRFQHLVSELKVLQLVCRSSSIFNNILGSSSWRTKKRSKLVGCTSPCDRNHSKWVLLTTSDSIVLHQSRRQSNRSLDAIHTFVVTARSILFFGKQPQFVLHSAGKYSGGPVGSIPPIVAFIRSRIGLDNRHMIWNRHSEYNRQLIVLTLAR